MNGVRPDANGIRPCDQVAKDSMNDAEITIFLLPLAKSNKRESSSAADPPGGKKPRNDKNKKGDGKGKKGDGKGKKGDGKGIPDALKAFTCRTTDGQPICFGLNLDGCPRKVDAKTNRCARGVHVCVKCQGVGHGLAACTN